MMEQFNCNGISNHISHIYYRGHIKSCNYTCYYCPFHKHKLGTVSIDKDKKLLYKFIGYIEEHAEHVKSIVFTPYGEVLIHEYYNKALARLSRLNNIRGIGCQTNLSFDIDNMVKVFLEAGGNLKKLRLWCTFHPTMVSVENFLISCSKLVQYGIKICVGAVADITMLDDIKRLRKKLDYNVYMWMNKMDGMKRKYTTQEIDIINKIDPFFELELKRRKADYKLCKGGKQSIFVNSSGDVYACNISNRKIFNLYNNMHYEKLEYNTSGNCISKRCDCYISYSLRKDIPEMVRFFPDPAFRIPLENLLMKNIKVVFFDIDGTLAAKGNGMNCNVDSAFVIKFIQKLSKKYSIYVATSLPYITAMKKCLSIKNYLSGGVFANGAYIKDFNTEYSEVIPIYEEVVALMNKFESHGKYSLRIYKKNSVVYKITLVPKSFTGNISCSSHSLEDLDDSILNNIKNRCNILQEDGVIQIAGMGVSKKNGIWNLCNKLGIDIEMATAIGDSVLDYDMMEKFKV